MIFLLSIAFSTNPTKCKQDQKRPQGEKAGCLPGVLKGTGTNIAFGDVCRLNAAFSIMYLKLEHTKQPLNHTFNDIFNTNDTHKEITNYSLPFPDPHI